MNPESRSEKSTSSLVPNFVVHITFFGGCLCHVTISVFFYCLKGGSVMPNRFALSNQCFLSGFSKPFFSYLDSGHKCQRDKCFTGTPRRGKGDINA